MQKILATAAAALLLATPLTAQADESCFGLSLQEDKAYTFEVMGDQVVASSSPTEIGDKSWITIVVPGEERNGRFDYPDCQMAERFVELAKERQTATSGDVDSLDRAVSGFERMMEAMGIDKLVDVIVDEARKGTESE